MVRYPSQDHRRGEENNYGRVAQVSITSSNHLISTDYIRLIRQNEKFRWLWFGQIISLLGDWFNLIASAALVASLTRSGVAIGGLFAVRMLAPFLVSPIAGVTADRYNRKTLLILTDIARGVIVFGFLLVRDAGDVWLIYALSALQLALSGFYFPARNAILPDITSRSELGAANTITSATWSTMLAFGSALGGLAAGVWGIYPAFIIDGLTFFFSALFISQITYEHTSSLSREERTIAAGLRQYVEGLRYLRRNLDILFISLHKAASSLLVGSAFQVIQVILAERLYPYGEGGSLSLGLLYAFVGMGTGFGPILARFFTGDRERSLRTALTASYLISSLGLALVAPLLSFPIVLVGTLLRGVGTGIGWVFSTQLLFELTPARVRGRVFASEFALFTLMNAAGVSAGGWLLDRGVGVSSLLWWMTSLALLPGVLWGIWVWVGHYQRSPQRKS